MIDDFTRRKQAVATFLCVRPSQSFHIVSLNGDGKVRGIEEVANSEVRINGGFFIFRQAIFDYMKPGEELVIEPFQRLIDEQRLHAYKYDKFWAAMDTFKEKQKFDDMYARGEAPWELWSAGANSAAQGLNGQ
jgi:glucose-1-phosphate cytidylyltransferase